MASASLNQGFKEELGSIEQWFSVLNDAERTAALYALLQQTTQVQVRFFAAVLQQMSRQDPMSSILSPEKIETNSAIGSERSFSSTLHHHHHHSNGGGFRNGGGGGGGREFRFPDVARSAAATSGTSPPAAQPDVRSPGPTIDNSALKAMFPDAAAAIATHRARINSVSRGSHSRHGSQGIWLPSLENTSSHRTASYGGGGGGGGGNGSRSGLMVESPWGPAESPSRPRSADIGFGGASEGGVAEGGEMGRDVEVARPGGPEFSRGHVENLDYTPYKPSWASMTSTPASYVLTPYGTHQGNNKIRRWPLHASSPGGFVPNSAAGTGPHGSNSGNSRYPMSTPVRRPEGAYGTAQQVSTGNRVPSVQTRSAEPSLPPGLQASSPSSCFRGTPGWSMPMSSGGSRGHSSTSPFMRGMPETPDSGHVSSILSSDSFTPGGNSRMHEGTPPARQREDAVALARANDIAGYLKTLRLHKYTPNLRGLTCQELVELDDDALQAKGVTALGARRKMLKSFESIREQLSAKLEEGDDQDSASVGIIPPLTISQDNSPMPKQYAKVVLGSGNRGKSPASGRLNENLGGDDVLEDRTNITAGMATEAQAADM